MRNFGRFAILVCNVVFLFVLSFVSAANAYWSFAVIFLMVGLILAFHLPQSWHLARTRQIESAFNPKE